MVKIINLNNIIKIIAYLLAMAILAFTFVMLTKVLPYMTFVRAINFLGTKTDEVLNKQHFLWSFYIHITSSLFVMGGGVFQFFPVLIKKFPRFHQNIGKLYVFFILVLAAPSGLVLATYANGGLAAQVGFSLQCLVWWVVTYLAWNDIMKKKYINHANMMIRSFAVTLAAMSLRTESYVMYYWFGTKPIETYLTVTWLSWVGNLLLAEVLIYNGLGKKIVQSVFKEDNIKHSKIQF